MDRPTLKVADVFRRYGDTYRDHLGPSLSMVHRRVMTAIEPCRTAALGGHVEPCDRCAHTRIWYNSCRNRHGPTCQSLARAAWIEDRTADLLDTEYVHVVFTVPQAIAEIASQNQSVVYGILFRATAETLRTIAADPKHLGAAIGCFAVLHTWGQTLVHHLHLHCVVPGGGLSPEGTRWISCRPGFFLPVRVLSRLFRRLFLTAVHDAFDDGLLRFAASLQALSDPQGFADHLQPARQTEWVVYAKPPFAGPPQVLDYVGRYTHRVALSNHRLIDIDDGYVRVRFKDDRADPSQTQRTMTLGATEFIRRFLLHVLPPGFHRIRYDGLFGNRHRREHLTQCRHLLGMAALPERVGHATIPADYRDRYEGPDRLLVASLSPLSRRPHAGEGLAPDRVQADVPAMRDALLKRHATYIDTSAESIIGFASQVAQVYKELTGNEFPKKAAMDDARRAHERHHGIAAIQSHGLPRYPSRTTRRSRASTVAPGATSTSVTTVSRGL